MTIVNKLLMVYADDSELIWGTKNRHRRSTRSQTQIHPISISWKQMIMQKQVNGIVNGNLMMES